MNKKILMAVVLLIFAGIGKADTVQLDLLNLGCPTELNFNSPSWQTNFDLGVTFTEISNVYIDWSGGITACQVVEFNANPPRISTLDTVISASLGSPRIIQIWGGEGNYPLPEPFSSLDEFPVGSSGIWTDLLDGKGTITIGHGTPSIDFSMAFVTYGSATFDKVTLMVEGTVPEPATFVLLSFGLPFLRVFHKKKNLKK